MHRLALLLSILLLPIASGTTVTIETASTFSMSGHFTSGLFNGKPVDIIETAYLNQERIVLFFEWTNLKKRRYDTKARILDSYGNLLAELINNFETEKDSYSTYYWYQPKHGDLPGDWVFEIYVDGQKLIEARIPVRDSQ